jgi:CelD/BcsL family acetyltransferase involved in cellulose biosynthesis
MNTALDGFALEIHETRRVTFHAHQGPLGLEQLAPQWSRLVTTIPKACFYHYPDWYRAYLRSHRCDPASVWFIAAYRKPDELVAIFPLQFQSRRVRFLKPRYLGTIDDDELQLSDFVFSPSSGNATLLRDLIGWLRTESTFRWDILRLIKISGESSLAYVARTRMPRATVAAPYDASAYFDTSGSYEHATRDVTSKFRSNLRRRTRIAESSANLRFLCYRNRDELDEAFGVFLDIEASGWKGTAGTSSAIRCRPEVLCFYTELVRAFSARNECIITLLWLGNQAIAGQIGFRIGKTLHILKVGYRDINSTIAPGILLQDQVIRYSCNDPDIDMLSMVNDPHWATSFKPLKVDVLLYFAPNWTVRGLIMHGAMLIKRWWRAGM